MKRLRFLETSRSGFVFCLGASPFGNLNKHIYLMLAAFHYTNQILTIFLLLKEMGSSWPHEILKGSLTMCQAVSFIAGLDRLFPGSFLQSRCCPYSVTAWQMGSLLTSLRVVRLGDFMESYPKFWVFLAQRGPRGKESRAGWEQV